MQQDLQFPRSATIYKEQIAGDCQSFLSLSSREQLGPRGLHALAWIVHYINKLVKLDALLTHELETVQVFIKDLDTFYRDYIESRMEKKEVLMTEYSKRLNNAHIPDPCYNRLQSELRSKILQVYEELHCERMVRYLLSRWSRRIQTDLNIRHGRVKAILGECLGMWQDMAGTLGTKTFQAVWHRITPAMHSPRCSSYMPLDSSEAITDAPQASGYRICQGALINGEEGCSLEWLKRATGIP